MLAVKGALIGGALGILLIFMFEGVPQPSLLPTPTPPVSYATLGPVGPPGASPEPRTPPVGIRIPAIGVQHLLRVVDLNPDGTLAVPSLADVAWPAWYDHSPVPGEPGPAVIVGHVDSAAAGPGVFYRLRDLRPNDVVGVIVSPASTVVEFTVYAVEQYPKAAFPTARVYGDTAGPELRLITCGGSFDPVAHSYRDNIVVYAKEVP